MVFHIRYTPNSSMWPERIQIFGFLSLPYKISFSGDNADCDLVLPNVVDSSECRTTTVSTVGNQWKISLFTQRVLTWAVDLINQYTLNLTTSFRKIFSVGTPGHPLIIPKHCHERYRKILSNEVAWPISFIYLCIYFPYWLTEKLLAYKLVAVFIFFMFIMIWVLGTRMKIHNLSINLLQ